MLIADDYAPLRKSMRVVLENAGFEVIEAENGAVALGTLVSNDVDVVLLDLNMPVCDGYEVLRRLDRPRPPVIVLSAFKQDSAAEVLAEFDDIVFAVLRKPVAPALLCDRVSSASEEARLVQS